jgi:cytidylate kinase
VFTSGPKLTDPAIIIAVDGPAASGKGTLARRMAEHFGLRHIDSGKLYRATAWRVLRDGGDPSDSRLATRAARNLVENDLEAPELVDEVVGQAASRVATIPAVRAALVERQRALAVQPPGTIMDGRDIGTVVFPRADHKLFVTASLDCRAGRRWRELRDRGEDEAFESVRRNLAERDKRDTSRALAPLVPASDAVVIDTTDLDVEGALAAAIATIGFKDAMPAKTSKSTMRQKP